MTTGTPTPAPGERLSHQRSENGALSAAIAQAMVQIYAECYGRGPTKARAHVLDDVVLVVLEGISTKVEVTLADNGEGEAVRELRRRFQRAVRQRFVTTIESATGRRVRAFMSETSLDPDVAVEVFLLAGERAEPAVAA